MNNLSTKAYIKQSDSHLPVILLLLFIFTLCVAFIYRSPYDAGAMPTQPDEGEYTVGAWRLANLGQYNIVILNKVYPDRYSPGFPLLLAVVYKIFPSDLGNGILVVFIAAICGVVVTWYIGKWFGSIWSASLGVLALLMVSDFRLGATTILSDTPSCVLALITCLLYLRIRNIENPGTR